MRSGSVLVVVAIWFIAACGNSSEVKQPSDCHSSKAGCEDGGAAADNAGGSGGGSSAGGQLDSGGAASASAGTDSGASASAGDAGHPPTAQDEMDKSVSVCGDEAMPIEKRVRPKIKTCFFDAKVKNPALDGHVRITFVIDPKGKITKTEIAQARLLGAEATACMMKALSESKLDGSKCPGKTVGFEQAFGHAAKD